MLTPIQGFSLDLISAERADRCKIECSVEAQETSLNPWNQLNDVILSLKVTALNELLERRKGKKPRVDEGSCVPGAPARPRV